MSRLKEHNKEIISQAQFRAGEMKTWPSKLEERMQALLEHYQVKYECQKIFYIYADDGWIIRYYIADFYIPAKKIIIEVDGKFHDDHKQHDKQRTKDIQKQYPDTVVLRYKWKDLSDENTTNELLTKIM